MLKKLKNYSDFILSKAPILYKLILRSKSNHGRREKQLYLTYVKKGFRTIDVGANVGDVTLWLSNIAGKNGRVFSFEAMSSTYEKLLKNIKTESHYNNIQTFNLAIGEENKNVIINTPDEDHGQASLAIQEAGSWKNAAKINSVEATCITLDSCMETLGEINFIKMDIEGAELLAIRGATALINKFKPTLYIEIYKEWTKQFNYMPLDIYNLLASMGYKNFSIVDDGHVTTLVSPKTQLDVDKSLDLLCVY